MLWEVPHLVLSGVASVQEQLTWTTTCVTSVDRFLTLWAFVNASQENHLLKLEQANMKSATQTISISVLQRKETNWLPIAREHYSVNIKHSTCASNLLGPKKQISDWLKKLKKKHDMVTFQPLQNHCTLPRWERTATWERQHPQILEVNDK